MLGNKNIVRFSVDCKAAKRYYRFELDTLVFKEDGNYIAYCPALDITEASDTFNSVISGFFQHFQLYTESCIEHCTLLNDLRAHGWKVDNEIITPPKK